MFITRRVLYKGNNMKKTFKIFLPLLLCFVIVSNCVQIVYAESNLDKIFTNTFSAIKKVITVAKENGVKPWYFKSEDSLDAGVSESESVANATDKGMQQYIYEARNLNNQLPDSLLDYKRTFSSILDNYQHPIYERIVFIINRNQNNQNQHDIIQARKLIKDISALFKSSYSSALDNLQDKLFVIASQLVDKALSTKNQADIDAASKAISDLKTMPNEFSSIDIKNFIKEIEEKLNVIIANNVGVEENLQLNFNLSGNEDSAWTGKWIWQSADGPNNIFISFRKTVNLSAKPSSAIANIAAENEYWLYVNGNLVVEEGGIQGRPDLDNTYYDYIDIASYLQTGSNTIAVLVWYKGGNNGYTQRMVDKGGLFFECNLTGATPAKIISDSTWKIKVNPAFNKTDQLANPSDGAYKWVAYPIKYDARNEINGWFTTKYNDSSWSAAAEKGIPPVLPWNDLKPRTIPLWKDYGLVSYSNLTLPMAITSSSNSHVYTIEGSLEANIQGTEYMKINAPAGVKVKMTMNDFYYVEYTTKEGVQEFDSMTWQNTDRLNTRYEFSNIPTGKTVQILDLKFHQTSYNTSIIGNFISNDSNLNSLWVKAKNTSFVCMRDYFMDCPNRERGQWWGDVSVQTLYSYYLYDTNTNLLAQKGFRELFNSQKDDGSLYTTAPGDVFNLPDQNLAAAISLWDYYMYTGDSTLIDQLYPNVKKFINGFASFRNSDGMIIQQSGPWNWIDWGSNMDNQDGSANTVVNALFINLLEVAKNMASLSGNSGDIPIYQEYQNAVKKNFNTYFWSNSKNAYVYNWKNGVQSSCIDDRSNAWAVLAGMTDSSKVSGVIDVLTKQYDSSPYQERYVEEALFKLGEDTQAIIRMRNRHMDMINSWSATLWEEYPAKGSNNHAWSSGPIFLLDAYALGIKPISAGYLQFKFEPHFGDLTNISAIIPSVKGNIIASISSTSTLYTQNLSSPSNTSAIISIPKNMFASSSGTIDTIRVGNTIIYQLGVYKGGVSGINFNSEDDNYIRFNVNSGNWSFVATMIFDGSKAGYTY
jgi:hypothetical protein